MRTNSTARAGNIQDDRGIGPCALMQAILWDRIKIADVVGVKVISLDEAPSGYAEFDAGAPVKFVIDPHGQLKH